MKESFTGKKCLITGSSGLVGSEAVKFLCDKNWEVVGIDKNIREYLFGKDASTTPTKEELENKYTNFQTLQLDIRDPETAVSVFRNYGPFDFVIHTAAQPAHEWSTNHALEDFALNATATINVLEAYRQYNPHAPFIQVSSSKVYGDSVNNLPLEEYKTRYDLPITDSHWSGMEEEDMRLDGNLHSLFGASKACGDIVAHEYGTYFKLPITIFRPVCITGQAHKGARLHGYLAYLVKCIAEGTEYTINGYKGKQVRDNIHGYDLVNAFWQVYEHQDELIPGEAYNIGGGRESNNSILEAIAQTEELLGKKAKIKYSDITRRGDHIWCIYSSNKFRKRYPEWSINYDNNKIMEDLCQQYVD